MFIIVNWGHDIPQPWNFHRSLRPHETMLEWGILRNHNSAFPEKLIQIAVGLCFVGAATVCLCMLCCTSQNKNLKNGDWTNWTMMVCGVLLYRWTGVCHCSKADPGSKMACSALEDHSKAKRSSIVVDLSFVSFMKNLQSSRAEASKR